MKSFRTFTLCAGFIASMFAFLASAGAQSLLSGDISGTVTDPTTALVVGAKVDLKSLDTGAAQGTKTDGYGVFRFSLLRPGSYSVTVTLTGFQTAEK